MSLSTNAFNAVKNWWWFIIKGLLLIIAGVACLMRPLESYAGLSVLFSIVILGAGASQVIFAVSNKDILPGWGWTLISGIMDLAIGLYLVTFPVITMVTLPFIVGFWLMFRSFYIMGISFNLNELTIKGWGWLLTGGILLLLFSIFIIAYPGWGAISIVSISAVAFIIGGALNIFLAIKFRQMKTAVKSFLK